MEKGKRPSPGSGNALPRWNGLAPVADFGERDAFDQAYAELLLPLAEIRIFECGFEEGQEGRLDYCRMYPEGDDPATGRFWYAGAIAMLPKGFGWMRLESALGVSGVKAKTFAYEDGMMVYMTPRHAWEDPAMLGFVRRAVGAACGCGEGAGDGENGGDGRRRRVRIRTG